MDQKSNLERREKLDLRILYAEDNSMARETIVDVLELRYSHVEAVPDGGGFIGKTFCSWCKL